MWIAAKKLRKAPLIAGFYLRFVALSRAGWSLLVPPDLPNSSQANTSVPLSQWINSADDEYDTQEQCESDLEHARQQRKHVGARLNAKADEASQCVSSDDPRLKADQPATN